MSKRRTPHPPRSHVKKGDTVMVIRGGDRGRKGRVLEVRRKDGKAIVEGLHMVKKHMRPNPQQGIQGGILNIEAPIHLSNLMVVCPECGRPTRVRKAFLEDGRKVRACRHCGGVLDREWVK